MPPSLVRSGPGVQDNYEGTNRTKGAGLILASDVRDNDPTNFISEHNYFVPAPRAPWQTTYDGMRERFFRLKKEFTLNMGPFPYSAAYAWRHWFNLAPDNTMLGPTAKEIQRGSLNFLPPHLSTHEGTTLRACADFLWANGNIDDMLTQPVKDPSAVRELIEDFLMNGRTPLILGARWPIEFLDDANAYVRLKTTPMYPVAVILSGWNAQSSEIHVHAPYGLQWGRYGMKRMTSYDLLTLLHQEDVQLVTAIGKRVGYEASRIKRMRAAETAELAERLQTPYVLEEVDE